MLKRASANLFPDRAVAVTAIEHGKIIITVTSRVQEAEASLCTEIGGPYVTTIFGGPLGGETVVTDSWKMMLSNHAVAVARVTEFIADGANSAE